MCDDLNAIFICSPMRYLSRSLYELLLHQIASYESSVWPSKLQRRNKRLAPIPRETNSMGNSVSIFLIFILLRAHSLLVAHTIILLWLLVFIHTTLRVKYEIVDFVARSACVCVCIYGIYSNEMFERHRIRVCCLSTQDIHSLAMNTIKIGIVHQLAANWISLSRCWYVQTVKGELQFVFISWRGNTRFDSLHSMRSVQPFYFFPIQVLTWSFHREWELFKKKNNNISNRVSSKLLFFDG